MQSCPSGTQDRWACLYDARQSTNNFQPNAYAMSEAMSLSATGYNFNNASYYTGGPVTSHAHPLQAGNSWNGGQQSLGN